MKRLPQPVCPWCGCDFREKRSNAAPICPDCDTQLRNLPVEKLVEMIVYLAGYNHVTLRLLVEGQDVIRGFTSRAVPRHVSTKDASLRQDLIDNSVQHEVVAVEETVATEQALDAALESETEHDLTIWPREHLETCLDSDDQGRIPLNEARLQDLLEDAFDRDEQLVRSFRQSRDELNPDVKRQDRGDPLSSQNGVLERSESFETA